jgi:hypothetical protein
MALSRATWIPRCLKVDGKAVQRRESIKNQCASMELGDIIQVNLNAPLLKSDPKGDGKVVQR